MLSCSYPAESANPPVPETSRLIPRAITISLENRTVKWSDISTGADISDTEVAFGYGGFRYVLNRLTGEIRFSNPAKLLAWQRYYAQMLDAARLSGRPEEIAIADKAAAEQQARDFAGTEHVGKCDSVRDKVF